MSELQVMNEHLRPVAPPRILDAVYTQNQFERIVEVIKRNGPWPTITAQTFETVEELVATTSGPMARRPPLNSCTAPHWFMTTCRVLIMPRHAADVRLFTSSSGSPWPCSRAMR